MGVFKPKRNRPITIRLGATSYVLADARNPEDHTIDNKGIIFLDSHYGMDIIGDEGKKYRYGTQRKIDKVEMQDGYLIIYEEGKSIPWKIDINGVIINRAKFDSEKDIRYVTKSLNLSKRDISKLNDYEPFIEEDNYLITPKTSNPLIIFLNDDNKIKQVLNGIKPTIIAKDVDYEMEYFSSSESNHYGFKVMGARKSMTFPTQCPIQGIFIENGRNGRIRVIEEGKSHAWRIGKDMTVKDYAHFDDYRMKDSLYLKKHFHIDKSDIDQVNSYGLKYINQSH